MAPLRAVCQLLLLVGATQAAVVPFTLVLSRKTGFQPYPLKEQFVVNGTWPGPTLYAQPGDTLQVLVISNLTHEDTAVHWHGMTQRLTPFSDGVIGVVRSFALALLGGTHSWRAIRRSAPSRLEVRHLCLYLCLCLCLYLRRLCLHKCLCLCL